MANAPDGQRPQQDGMQLLHGRPVGGATSCFQGRLQAFVTRGDLAESAASWRHLVQNCGRVIAHGPKWIANRFLARMFVVDNQGDNFVVPVLNRLCRAVEKEFC